MLWNDKDIRVKRNGTIYYVYCNYFTGLLEAKDMSGIIYDNLIITTDFNS